MWEQKPIRLLSTNYNRSTNKLDSWERAFIFASGWAPGGVRPVRDTRTHKRRVVVVVGQICRVRRSSTPSLTVCRLPRASPVPYPTLSPRRPRVRARRVTDENVRFEQRTSRPCGSPVVAAAEASQVVKYVVVVVRAPTRAYLSFPSRHVRPLKTHWHLYDWASLVLYGGVRRFRRFGVDSAGYRSSETIYRFRRC